jgi:hypothetical protein
VAPTSVNRSMKAGHRGAFDLASNMPRSLIQVAIGSAALDRMLEFGRSNHVPASMTGGIEGTVSAPVIRATRSVPAEFAGRARVFRNRILASDNRVGPAINAITAYARDVLRRRHTYRPEHFKHLERAWRLTIPDMGRLAYATERGKDSLSIADARLCSSTFHKAKWENEFGEHSLALIIYSGRFTRGHIDIEAVPVSAVSLHALARRFQRSFDSSNQAVLRDLSLINFNAKDLLNTSPFRQPAGDGAWHGEVVTVATSEKPAQRILATRTFI